MIQFHDGQKVEVDVAGQRKLPPANAPEWNKATIIHREIDHDEDGVSFFGDGYEVQFHDGTRAMCDTEHIIAVGDVPIPSVAAPAGCIRTRSTRSETR